jgi:hypothetical protein
MLVLVAVYTSYQRCSRCKEHPNQPGADDVWVGIVLKEEQSYAHVC